MPTAFMQSHPGTLVLRSQGSLSTSLPRFPQKTLGCLCPPCPQAPRPVPRGRAEVAPKALPPLLQDPRQGPPRGPLRPPAQPAPPDAQPPAGQGRSKYSARPSQPVLATTLGIEGGASCRQCTTHVNAVLGKYPTGFRLVIDYPNGHSPAHQHSAWGFRARSAREGRKAKRPRLFIRETLKNTHWSSK